MFVLVEPLPVVVRLLGIVVHGVTVLVDTKQGPVLIWVVVGQHSISLQPNKLVVMGLRPLVLVITITTSYM